MFYEDYDPRIGPATMPSPHSEYAPYYSGYADTFEDFLDEFEGRAYDCELTDPQRVDALIRYIDPSIRELCMSLTGFRPRDWPVFRQSLLDTFGHTTPRPQVMRQKLQNYVQGSSERRMECVDDVLQYYRDFLCYSAPLVHAGHLTEEDRDAAFWCGFHPEDRKALQPRLIGKNPLQPPDIPFHFEDVFHCARAAFAYDGASLSWSSEYQFKSPSVRCEQPVAEHVSRDNYGPREMSRAVVSNAETESTHSSSELLSPSTPDPQLPLSSSLSALELQHSHMRSATVNQPEDAPTFSNPTSTLPISSSLSASEFQQPPTHSATVNQPEHESKSSISLSTLLPSISPFLTSSPSLAPSVAEDDPERAPTFSNSPSTFLPSASPTQSIFRSLERSAADAVPEIASTPPPFTSITPACPLTLSILSNFEYLPSETEEEPESEPASMSSTTPSSLPLQSTPFLSFPSDFDVPELASAPPSSLSISSDPECLPSAMKDQPESESASTFRIPSKLDLPPRMLSPILDHLPESSPSLSTPEVSPSLEVLIPNTFPVALLPDRSSFLSENLSPCEFESASTPSSTVDVVLPSFTESSPSSLSEVIPHTSDANLLPPPLEVSPSTPVLALSLSLQQSLEVTPDDLVSSPLEVKTALAPRAISFIPQQIAAPQWLLYLVPQLLRSQEPSSSLDVSSTRAPCPLYFSFLTRQWLLYLVLQLVGSQEHSAREVLSTPVPRLTHSLPPLRLSSSHSTHFDFALIIVTTAVLVFVFPNVLATFLSHACKFGNKNKDLGDSRNGTPKSCNSDTFAQRRQLRQYTPHALRLVFDPGGPTSTHEDARKRKSKTRGPHHYTRRYPPHSRSSQHFRRFQR